MEWVSVDKTLPSKQNLVLFTDGEDVYQGYWRWCDGKPLFYVYDGTNRVFIEDITHWSYITLPCGKTL